MHNVMLDLETWSTRSNAAIRSIGACVFDQDGILSKFYANVETFVGLDIDQNTVDWWRAQSQEAQDALEVDKKPLIIALGDFINWLPEPANQCLIWGNGSDFDNVILASSFDALRLQLPWKFYNNRCYRTVKNLFSIARKPQPTVKHNALDDAVAQAEHLIAIRNNLYSHLNIDLFNPEHTVEHFENWRAATSR